MSLCLKDPGIHRSEKETYLSSNHEFVAGSTHGGLEEDVRDEEGNVGLGRSIGDGGGNVPSELDGLISGLGVQLPVTADEGLASVKLGGRSASEGGGGEGGGRSGEEGGNGELHGGIYESWWNGGTERRVEQQGAAFLRNATSANYKILYNFRETEMY